MLRRQGRFGGLFSPANGRSGGLLILWNTDMLDFHDTISGTFSLSILFSLRGSDSKWAVTDPRQKANFWKEIANVGRQWGVPWLLCGDFNAIRSQGERSSGQDSKKQARDFSRLIDD